MHVNDLYTLLYYHWALDTETFPTSDIESNYRYCY